MCIIKQILFGLAVFSVTVSVGSAYAQEAIQIKSFASQEPDPSQSSPLESSIEGMLEKPIMQQSSDQPPNELAVQLIFHGDKEQGLKQLELAHQNDPGDCSVLFNLSGYYLGEKDYENALEKIDKALAISPQDLQYLKRKTDCLLPLKKFSEAAETYKKIIELDPQQGEAYCKLGALYGLLGRWEESEASLLQARTIVGDEPSLLNNLASARLMMKKYEQAIEVLAIAQQSWPTADREITLGVAYEGLGDKKAAMSHYQKAKELGTTNKHLEAHMQRVSVN